MLYLADPAGELEVDTIIGSRGVAWKEIDQASPNFGFTNTAYWFRFNLQNQEAQKRDVLIELPIPFLDDIRLYKFQGIELLSAHLVGDKKPFNERPILHQNFVMPFQLDPGDNQFVMRVQAAGTVEAPLFIWTPNSFAVADGNERLLQGIWFGVLGIMVIYNLFLYALLRDIAYLYYVGFVASYLLFQGALKGYGFAYVWQDMLVWNSYAISVFIAASNFFAVVMVNHFLGLKAQSERVHRLMSIAAGIGGVLLLSTFVLPYSLTVRVNSGVSMLVCILALFTGYWSWAKGNYLAKYFCLAWTAAFVGVAILVAAKFGVVPANLWTNNGGQIGVLAQVALLSFALASRFNREKEMRIQAQDLSLEHERMARQSQEALLQERENANLILEQNVKKRTEDLEAALAELESANKQLEIMSTEDALTQIYNRRHFENRFADEFKRASRHKRQLSIILCDIDHFKAINDQNGHQAGDECLQVVAKLLKERIARTGDLIARYGGEEFIALLADTSLERAQEVAEDLRASIENMNFEFNGKHISVTASFGVSSLNPMTMQSSDQLVTQADVALYEAKNAGRNRVHRWSAGSINKLFS